ncbi:MAG: YggS family pyridoxal phosphate-dependent enzyme [Alphaproteobacteria bacterium]|uniref:YggS family pyridoxal phosphate-dependent enzyme n=1 Tax=Brevundimonas sp. TaxID=1871086 RepID=UPI0025C11401|nr:YggS family pyridoxal phosphate-dependent enzyme [Brevundimonas sp.]MBU4196031.1 YggS family pyridoxal phosphate-dependent enzyme [Alphaproteobacteria bacterium]MCG2664157.1 YggS family pyridoxal phosphate-dependent enzyme [Brevundimonas sp.]
MTPSSPASPLPSIAERVAGVRARIDAACHAAGRDPAAVTLTAVSKTQPDEAIDAILATGQRVFGENRVQEAQARWTERLSGLDGLELRLIGPLQTNKAEDAVVLFDVIETLDREKLARALAEAAQKRGRSPRVLVQVNTGAEPQKAGVLPEAAAALIDTARRTYGLTVEGLMCIPPADQEAEPHFALLRDMAERNGLSVLSMGMSGDYETAIRCGATHVRVGTALFGERNRP